ncbi:MAG: hypothetical protein P8016_09220 [Sedimentisphaerales bacterium]
MTTEAQIKANRENAKKSTGPRTARGKEVVSQNALKHGLCAKKNVIKSESQEEFNLFRDVMMEDLAPVGGMELMLAQRIVALSWRLRRAEHFQNVLVDALIDFSMQDCRSRVDNAQEEARAGDFDLITGYALKRDFADARSLDLLLSYEKRIESSLYKATAEFRKTQKLRCENVSRVSSPRMHGQSVPRDTAKDEDAHAAFCSGTPTRESHEDADTLGEVSQCAEQSQFAGFQPEILNSKSEILNRPGDVDPTGQTDSMGMLHCED